MFGSRTLLRHLLRGVVGFGALGGAVFLAQRADTMSVIASVLLALLALTALGGCPACWFIGLTQTRR